MIFQSSILALLLASSLSGLIIVWSAWFASRVLQHWQINSGHARQIQMERKTYLVSTALTFVMVLELVSLLLFVYNADKMAVMFVGAMCAVGTLNANEFGFPALLFKLASFFGASVWLILNHIDGKGRDYPLTRFKYGFLIALAPVLLIAGVLQFTYFYNLDANIITSCCSRLFTPENSGIEATLSSLDARLSLGILFGGFGLMVLIGGLSWIKSRISMVYALFTPLFFTGSIVAIISVVAPYIYEQPYHHCPFCILKPEYNFIGYGLYLTLFFGTAFGLAAGFLSLPIKALKSGDLTRTLPAAIRSCLGLSLASYSLFALLCGFAIWASNLVMFH
ncbi:MAG: hypothetical protein N4A65_10990 [Cohaesibacter sp.]|jgi:hypothetical protein|nr:hypothetical protein [Cohaesibacter sp.]